MFYLEILRTVRCSMLDKLGRSLKTRFDEHYCRITKPKKIDTFSLSTF